MGLADGLDVIEGDEGTVRLRSATGRPFSLVRVRWEGEIQKNGYALTFLLMMELECGGICLVWVQLRAQCLIPVGSDDKY